MFRLAGFGPSRKNPNMCTSCFERAPLGGSEMEIGVLFGRARLHDTRGRCQRHARLQGQAGPGQLVLSERVYEAVSGQFPAAAHVELELKGKSAPVPAYVIDLGAPLEARV